MNTRFKKLLHRFQRNIATKEEVQELMKMVESGHYDDQTGEEWEKMLKKNMESSASGDKELDRKLNAIRAEITIEPEKSGTNNNRKRWIKLVGGIAAAAAVALFFIMIINSNRESIQPEKMSSDIVQKMDIGRTFSGKQFVALPDGSTVILNEKSELSYESGFGEKVREVSLTGEAYFDIVHNKKVPFLVRTGKIKTRVLGTAFNIEAWPDQQEVKITVTRGKVAVSDDQKVYGELTLNEQLAINTETEVFEKKKLDAEEAVEWKSSFFVLDKVTMENAARQISERYDVEVFIENKQLRNCLVNGAFLDNESVEHVVSVLCLAMNATYEIEGDKVKILGGIGCE